MKKLYVLLVPTVLIGCVAGPTGLLGPGVLLVLFLWACQDDSVDRDGGGGSDGAGGADATVSINDARAVANDGQIYDATANFDARVLPDGAGDEGSGGAPLNDAEVRSDGPAPDVAWADGTVNFDAAWVDVLSDVPPGDGGAWDAVLDGPADTDPMGGACEGLPGCLPDLGRGDG